MESLEPLLPPPPPSPMIRPTWTYFLVPGAIVLAGIVVAAAMFFGNGQGLTLFAKKEPKTGTITYTIDDLKAWAKKAGVKDAKAFAACLDSHTTASRVERDQQSGSTLGVQGTPSFFINGMSLVGAQPFDVFQQAIGAAVTQGASATPQPLLALQADDHIEGKADAPVTIVEYSDFQCPFCRSFFDATLSQIRTQFIKTGKAKLVYRHYPLSQLHPMAQISAEAAECAAAQGKFWEMHDAIFTLQAQ